MALWRNRVAAMIAALAMVLQALWPLLAHARAAQRGVLVPVCTIDGVTHYLELPAGRTPLEQRSSSHHEHCQACVFGSDRQASLPLAGARLFAAAVDACAPLPDRRRRPPGESSAHFPEQPRAPPVFA